MRTFDVRFKQKVVRAYLSGKGGYKILSAKYDIADSLVRKWVRADRLDTKLATALLDKCGQDLRRRPSSAWAENALTKRRISLPCAAPEPLVPNP